MERDYDYVTAVHGADLEDGGVDRPRAGERAVRRLNPRKVDDRARCRWSTTRASPAAWSAIWPARSTARRIARGTSFLKDKLGQRIFAAGVSIIDDPHRKRGLRSKPFDGEGLANQRRALIDEGVLTTWVLDLRSARQLGLTTTGHAARGTGGPPSPSPTNLYLAAGQADAERADRRHLRTASMSPS